MFTCSNCGKTYDTYVNFCDNCGCRFVAQGTPIAPKPVPVSTPAPQASPKNIAGMVLAIVGLCLDAFAAIYFLFGAVVGMGTGIDEAAFMFSIFGLVFSLIALPFAIVGLSISSKHLNSGSTHKTAKLGRTFGVVSTIVAGAILFLSILVLLATA